MNTVRGNGVDPERGKPIVRWLLALVSFHGASASEIEYRDDSPVKQGSGERFSTSTPYPSEAILKKVMGDDFENSLDRVILVSTQDGLDQLLENKLDFKDRIHNWTVKSSNPSNSVISLPVEFANFDVMKLWNQFDEATREFNPPDEIIADLSGLGVHHSVALSRVLKTYSMIRSLSAEQNSLKVKVYSTTLDKTPDVKDKGWVIDQGVLDPIDEFSRGVYEFTKFSNAESLITLVKSLLNQPLEDSGVQKQFKKQASKFINRIRQFSLRLREGDVFGDPLNERAREDLQEFERSLNSIRPEFGNIIDKALQMLRELVEPDEREKLLLNQGELERQVSCAEKFLDFGWVSHALRVYREVIFCRILLQQGKKDVCCEGNWLRRENRKEAEQLFNYIHRSEKGPTILSEDYPVQCKFLDKIIDDRNHFAHSGYKRVNNRPLHKLISEYQKKRTELRKLFLEEQEFWEEIVKCDVSGHYLLTPIGTSPGVLTTLLENLTGKIDGFGPQLKGVVILTSQVCLDGISKALQASERYSNQTEFEVRVCLLDSLCEDIRVGPMKLQLHAITDTEGRAVMDVLKGCSRVTVNYTGGLSSMGVLIDRMARNLNRSAGVSVERVISVDRRTEAEIRKSPFVVGQIEKVLIPAEDE